MSEANRKITTEHLKRKAYLYVRQSSLKQVMQNTESTERQYALKERAIALGWPIEQVTVVDKDLGKSGAQSVDRKGFQDMVAEVGLGNVGIVMGLEVSRLARNSMDWHRLLEICALSNTLILDEDGLYDPSHYNDRLLLGLKGTMSEAELHVLKARLRGGALNKAKKGELKTPLPVGLVYSCEDRITLHPDVQVQESIRLLFKTFQELGSAWRIVKLFNERKLQFPRQQRVGHAKGAILWGPITHSRILSILKNPRYAGVYFYGRIRYSKLPNGKITGKLKPRDQWHCFLPNSHESYISLEEYEQNQKQLSQNAQRYGKDRRKSPPREGPALLQGIVVCGRCGKRMTIRYQSRSPGDLYPIYVCQRSRIELGGPMCQSIPGASIDEAIGELLIESVTPLALEVSLNVQEQLRSRLEEADSLRKKQVERAQYESDLSRQRYMQVDPNNRLVADTLEADWNEKLRNVRQVQEEYERQRTIDEQALTAEQKETIRSLSADFPRLWSDSKTPYREKKKMVRLLLEDVTLTRGEKISVGIRFKGGPTRILSLPVPVNPFVACKTLPEVVKEVDRLLEDYYDIEIADILNDKGFQTGTLQPFTAISVRRLRRSYQLKDRYTRLREKGMLNRKEMLTLLDVSVRTLWNWKKKGCIMIHAYGNSTHRILYEPPGKDFYEKLGERSRGGKSTLRPQQSREV
jgi:DNA invertase Pin-like site-specific DNA recombinase